MPLDPIDPKDPHANEPHRLEEMDKRLYRRDLAGRKIRRFDILRPKAFPVKHDFEKVDEPTPRLKKIAAHPSLFRKFFFVTLGFACLAALFAVVTFFSGGNTVSNNNIEINVLGNSFAAGGEEVPLEIEVVNKNASPLELSDLFVEYEKGGDASGGAGHVRTLTSLGTIPAGKTLRKNIFVTLYGAEASVKNIDFMLQYRISGSNAVFVKKSSFPVTISSAPLALTVDAPETISPNQRLTFTARVRSNAKDTVSGVLFRMEYPSGFKFDTASPAATSFNNVWDLGDLAPGAERSITVSGTIYGQDGEERGFHMYVGAKSATDGTKIGVTYNSLLKVVALTKPFLAADLAINGVSDATVAIPSASTAQVSIGWANNLPTQVTNAEITVKIAGNALNPASIVVPKGFYNSSDQTIIWNATTTSDLAVIQPGEAGTLTFSFNVLPLWRAGQPILVSPTVKFSVSIKGKQSSAGGVVGEVSNFEEKTAYVSSDLGFSEEALYNSGAFTNTGPIPPKANQPTTYTIEWRVTNSSNVLSGGQAQTTLPTYVDWVGTISPANERIEYDPTTRTVRWNIGQIPTGAGLTGAGRSVSFQIRLTPSTSQVGSSPKLLLETVVSALDTFTGEKLTNNRGAITTQLGNDPGFPLGGHIVTN